MRSVSELSSKCAKLFEIPHQGTLNTQNLLPENSLYWQALEVSDSYEENCQLTLEKIGYILQIFSI